MGVVVWCEQGENYYTVGSNKSVDYKEMELLGGLENPAQLL
jgi:hypothetical protein